MHTHRAIHHAVAAHTAAHTATIHHAGLFSTFGTRFMHSFVRTGVYRMFSKLGLFWRGQSLFVHALIVALAGCIIAALYKLIKHLFFKK